MIVVSASLWSLRNSVKCMCLSFGIEMREVGPTGHTYELVSILGLHL